MKYYLIETEKINDNTYPCAIFLYDTKSAALSAYHSTLASIYANENVVDFFVEVMDSNGNVYYMEKKDN